MGTNTKSCGGSKPVEDYPTLTGWWLRVASVRCGEVVSSITRAINTARGVGHSSNRRRGGNLRIVHGNKKMNNDDTGRPLAERVAKMEGVILSVEREQGTLRDSMERLRDKVEGGQREIVDRIANNHKEMIELFRNHIEQDQERHLAAHAGITQNSAKITSVKWWIAGMGVGVIIVVTLMKVLSHLGVLAGG